MFALVGYAHAWIIFDDYMLSPNSSDPQRKAYYFLFRIESELAWIGGTVALVGSVLMLIAWEISNQLR